MTSWPFTEKQRQSLAPKPEEPVENPLPDLAKAERLTSISGVHGFEMKFVFRSKEAMERADRQWKEFQKQFQ
jgi:hypothetical protein